jgi:aryl-alcohol dehydrogenase-like predicted oxidoreductase
MRQNPFGPLGHASALTLGGGGIGMLWGPTDRDEARATITAAIDGGIDVLDTAPIYAECEAIVGETFGGRLPAHVRITTKCQLGSPDAAAVPGIIESSLAASLAAMRLERVDVYFLHSNICADNYVYANRPDLQDRVATRWSLYMEQVVPTMQALRASGRIGAWGITGIGVPDAIVDALQADVRPDYVQAITNLLDSAGAIRRFAEPEQPRRIIAAANASGVAVMGIRAVQAGALTDAIDRPLSGNHPETKDFERAAPFRAWCAARGESVAEVAHRYALSMPGVATVVLGVKNRTELAECVRAEVKGPLDAATMAEIDALGLRG